MNFALIFASFCMMQVCRDCSDRAYSYHPWLALIFTLFFGLGLVACAVAFNLGVSPTLDSLLFFIQVSPPHNIM